MSDKGRSKPKGRRWIIVGLLTAALITVIWVRGGSHERLGLERLEVAEQRWREHGPRSYTMELVVNSARTVVHRIEVHEGQVVSMTTDGAEVPRRVWSQWTVEGLFDFLGQELSNATNSQRVYGISNPSHVVIRASFDPATGYPHHFTRFVVGRKTSIQWEVQRFEFVGSR